MNRILLLVASLAVFGCREDPARSVKIVDRPSETAEAPAAPVPAPAPVRLRTAAPQAEPVAMPVARPLTPSRAADPAWLADFCPPPLDDSAGPGNLVVSGPCEVQHKAPVRCESSSDDFITAFTQKALNGATLVTYINVEFYRGPGSYDGAQVFVAVQNRNAIWRWSNDNVHAVVAPGETSVTLSPARLLAEPMLLDCTRLIGPSTNYQYQCGARSNAGIVVSSPPELVSGKLQCLPAR